MTISRSDLIRAVQNYARTAPDKLTVRGLYRHGRVSGPILYKLFPGGFLDLLTAAGLPHRMAKRGRISKTMLLEEVHRVAQLIGHPPRNRDMLRHRRFGMNSFARTFGHWKDVLAAYDKWLKSRPRDDHDSPLALAPALSLTSGPEAPALSLTPAPEAPAPAPRQHDPRALVGLPLGFRGLLHAPTNELGVIHLFGVLWKECGLAIEHIGGSFPDCRALRADPATPGKWRRIAIEFELRSSNFRNHGHDPRKCDLIVCWEHDWPDCPLEVIDLRSRLATLTPALAA